MDCLLFISTSNLGCTHQMLCKICFFKVFYAKSWKRKKKKENCSKNVFFEFATKRWLRILLFLKMHFYPQNCVFWNKTCYQRLSANSKNPCFAKFCHNFLAFSCFFQFFAWKALKSMFWPGIGMHITRTLVKNMQHLFDITFVCILEQEEKKNSGDIHADVGIYPVLYLSSS